MKYKIGDKVRIRKDLIVDNVYGGDSFTEEMKAYEGKTATITDAYYDKYDIDIDDGSWCWTDEMIECLVDSTDSTEPELNEERAKTVDIGFYLEYCGDRVIENVCYGGYAHDHNHVFCTTADAKNRYVLPLDSIEFIIPHEVD